VVLTLENLAGSNAGTADEDGKATHGMLAFYDSMSDMEMDKFWDNLDLPSEGYVFEGERGVKREEGGESPAKRREGSDVQQTEQEEAGAGELEVTVSPSAVRHVPRWTIYFLLDVITGVAGIPTSRVNVT